MQLTAKTRQTRALTTAALALIALGWITLGWIAPAGARPVERAGLSLDGKRTVARHWRVPLRRPPAQVAVRPRPTTYQPASDLVQALSGLTEAKVFVPESQRLPKRMRRQARKAFGDFADYAQSLRRAGKELSPAEQTTTSQELVARAVHSLRADGVNFAVYHVPGKSPADSETRIEILPEGKHRLNREAARLDKGLGGLRMKYLPQSLMKSNFTAMYRKGDNAVFVGHEVIRRKGIGRQPVGLHELRHAHNHHDARASKPSPYYGTARKESGELPTAFQPLYSSYQSVDEIDTYALTLRTALYQQSARLRTGKQLKTYRQNMSGGVVVTIQHGLSLSARTVTMAKQSLGAISRGAKVEYKDNGGLVEASWLAGRKGAEYRMTVPLVKSAGVSDPSNHALLGDQLRWMKAAGRNNLTLFRVAAKAHDRIQATSDPRQKRTLIRALSKVMGQRRIERDPNAKPLGIDAGIALFNRHVASLAGR